jgi:hypothetical protein
MARTLTLVRNKDVANQADENVRLVVEMLLASRRLHRDALVPVLGVARSTVYAKLGGKQRFTVGEVALLAEFFEISPGAFLSGPSALLRSAVGSTISRKMTGHSGVSRPDTTSAPRLRAVA